MPSSHLEIPHPEVPQPKFSQPTFSQPTVPPPELSIDEITAWIRQAGQIGLSHFHRVSTSTVDHTVAHTVDHTASANHIDHKVSYKDDNTFVTAADIEIQQFLEEKIQAAFPHHAFIGEENTQNTQNTQGSSTTKENNQGKENQPSPYIWVVDPLDGTTAFALGLPGWGISVGLLYEGRPILGFFYMPLEDDLTYTTWDGQLYWNDMPLSQSVCETWLPKRFLAVNATAHADYDIQIRGTRSLGSIGANLVYTARGAAAAAFAPKAKLWDLVATASIIECAGGSITYIDGAEIDYLSLLDGQNVPQPVIAAHPQILAQLPALITPR